MKLKTACVKCRNYEERAAESQDYHGICSRTEMVGNYAKQIMENPDGRQYRVEEKARSDDVANKNNTNPNYKKQQPSSMEEEMLQCYNSTHCPQRIPQQHGEVDTKEICCISIAVP